MQFSIKDRVIIGDHDPKWIDQRSLAKLLLDTFTKNPDIIGQVSII